MGLSSRAIIGPVSLTSTATELHAVTVDGAVPVTVTYSATPTFNFNLGNLFKITLTGDATPSFTNVGTASRRTMFLIAQDATGGRAFTWPAGWTNMPPVTRTANAVTAVEALFDGTNAYPVAPGSNLKLQVDDKTINAGFFAGASNALRVNAAIAYAVANSFTAVRVPANLLPYDASSVTFNTGVMMIREGGPVDRLDVEAYGAALDDATDNFYAAQAMADAAAATNDITGLKRISFGNGRCRSSQPIWITGSGIQIEGTKQGIGTRFIGKHAGASAVVSTHQGGPSVLICQSTLTVLGLTTPLVSGAGNAYTENTFPPTKWWNFRDIKNLDINGLGAACFEVFYQSTFTADSAIIFHSFGNINGVNHSAMYLVNFSGKAQFALNVAGSVKTVTDPASTISDGLVHHIRGNYDGATVRLFVDGLLVASTAASGTITQHFSEEFYFGANRTAMEQSPINYGLKGTAYSPRVSNTARETTNFTPPSTNHSVDANTLIVVNFDLQRGPMTRAQTKDGDAWLVQRQDTPASNIYGMGVSGMTFDSSVAGSPTAIFLVGNVEFWTGEHVHFVSVRRGIFAPDRGNKFQWQIQHLHFKGDGAKPARVGIGLNAFGGIGEINTAWFFGDVEIPFYAGVGRIDLNNVWVNTNTKTCLGYWFLNQDISTAPLRLHNANVNCESGVSADWIGPVVAEGGGGTGGISAEASVFGNGGTQWIIARTLATAKFTSCVFVKSSGSPASIMKASGVFEQPVMFDGCEQQTPWLPWSDVAGTASVGKLGKLTAIAFSTPLTLDCSIRDDFELGALTGAITINFSNVTPGQKISLWTVQNAGGGNTITFGTVNGTGAVKGATANDTTGLHYSQYLFDCNLNGNMTQVGFSSGA